MALKAPKHISRTPVAWRVKIKQGDWTQTKHFNFDKYGGIKHALNCAIEWRDRLLKERGMFEYLDRKKSPDLQTTRRNQPCIGVYRTHNVQYGKTFYNWAVTIHKDRKQTKRSFSIAEYGEEFAFQLACEERFLTSGKLIVVNKKALPCKPDVPYIVKG